MITELECLSASLGGGTPDILLDINRSLTLRRNVANSPARNVVGRKMAKQKHKPHIKKDYFFLNQTIAMRRKLRIKLYQTQ